MERTEMKHRATRKHSQSCSVWSCGNVSQRSSCEADSLSSCSPSDALLNGQAEQFRTSIDRTATNGGMVKGSFDGSKRLFSKLVCDIVTSPRVAPRQSHCPLRLQYHHISDTFLDLVARLMAYLIRLTTRLRWSVSERDLIPQLLRGSGFRCAEAFYLLVSIVRPL
ncbi:hypothetical protein CB0940_08509 [Cercospora beticola]|uniref:Uncharacterized protein n=1 Tax=Cercospora beticola TaxID=122368 RepID=A0A2G5HR61_CERBT|nr:hypothetical protein CB0940_08509 [Cercospora beticola]PIA95020.1 hypothetical protein CB0940_08509 [Cercospora beticola]